MFYQFGGMPAREIVARLNRDFGWTLPPEETAHDKEKRFITLLPDIGPVPEVIAALHSLGQEANVAVASGGLTPIVRDTLRFVGLEVGPGEYIKHLVGSDQVKHGKPNPELFLKAAGIARRRAGALPRLRGRRARFPRRPGRRHGLHRRPPLPRQPPPRRGVLKVAVGLRVTESVTRHPTCLAAFS